ncbi:MAG: selenide, water dikinase SelD [Planctomycetes bacterium]|nr:selenide, water dikinase SelD [Planctomycetota bacterium]
MSMDPTAAAPIQKNVLLVGAGNAHIQFVKMFGMSPAPGVAVTLVCDFPAVPYSAMVPGHIGGDYTRDEITIDLGRLCRVSGVRFVGEAATAIDLAKRTVSFAARPELAWDVLSLGLGSLPALPPGLENSPSMWRMRPLGTTIDRLDALEKDLRAAPRPFHLAIAGGGASGCELALAIHRRFTKVPGFRLTVIQGNPRLLPTFPAKAAKILEREFVQRGIALRVGTRISGGDAGSLELDGKERVPVDAVLWATTAAPPSLLRSTGLPLDPGGFMPVHDTLQSVANPAVFGTGDCIAFVSHPRLPRNGVYAVRQGGILFRNLLSFLHERPLEPFVPQRFTRNILNTSDGQAVYTYGPLCWKSRRARVLKDGIDRAWMDKFTKFAPMGEAAGGGEEAGAMRCGGCGSKIAGDVLSAALKRLDVGEDARIIVGVRGGEDAAVHRMRPELFGKEPAKLVEVQTVDFFKAFTDDPFVFGRIAAIHAVSDIHAMNARPFSALAIATLPYARGPVQGAMLFELLSGAVQSLRAMGVTLTGGHTTEGAEMALGFSVTGYGEEDALFRKGGLRPGDALILTKPVGTGALLAAWMRAECRAEWLEAATRSMLLPNGAAAEIFARHGVRGCTDITGFGLGGHLLEMLDASGAGARLNAARVPRFAGFEDVVARGIVSSLHRDNAKVACRVQSAGSPPAWLFDPQTAGGLLAGVEAARAGGVVEELVKAGYVEAAIIGEVVAGAPSIELR